MPMMPGPLAALSYVAVKVIGYAFYGKQLNATLKHSVSPYRFGLGKTAIGLIGGVIYFFVIVPRFGKETSDWVLFLGAAPIRIAAWGIALVIFYKLHQKPAIFTCAILRWLSVDIFFGWCHVGDLSNYFRDGDADMLMPLERMPSPNQTPYSVTCGVGELTRWTQ